MKMGFYPKLAWEGIRKNKRLYLPYIMTCIGMVMMHYIISYLSGAAILDSVLGSETVGYAMSLGSWVIAVFSVLFLFYTNSFLIRRRKKEFGLYNILGMGKWNIGRIVLWESVIVAVLSLVLGLAAGALLAKVFELAVANLMGAQITYEITIAPDVMVGTGMIYGGIFLLLLLNSLRQIATSNPLELLRSENAGEKPPKANWLVGLAGAIILGIAYYIALTIESPVTALVIFFVAAGMVIVATYFLFGAGSVVMCRLLQKNKRYYYKANHFVSVSSMTYRMNRNGAGLASICVLLTMVMVMLSSTAALYVGTEEQVLSRYPRDINLQIAMNEYASLDNTKLDANRAEITGILGNDLSKVENLVDYRVGNTSGMLSNGEFSNERQDMQNFDYGMANDAVLLFVVPLEDYNRIMGTQQTLADDEVLIYGYRTDYDAPTIRVNDGQTYRVKEVVDDWVSSGEASMTVISTVYVFTNDVDAFTKPMQGMTTDWGTLMMTFDWMYCFDMDATEEEIADVFYTIRNSQWMNGLYESEEVASITAECQDIEREGFYAMFGGLLSLGILLSILFLAAAVLIIYYKQISEGYEDQKRFDIMRKVGMTKRDIRKSINSQMLTVFFLPLVTAGIHLSVAFPIIHKILQMFNMHNIALHIATTAGCFLIFGVFYALVYRITSNAYYSIVSGARENE